MIKRIFNISLLFVTLVLACVFFPALNLNFASTRAVEGVSGNRIVLTGIAGSTPEHFFLDESGQSTLVNAKTKSQKDEYYYLIASDGGQSSSGWGQYCPTTDVLDMINEGLVYAQATATISSKETNVKVTISAGDKSQSASAVNGEIKTPLLKLDSAENIKFSFETSGRKNSFMMSEPTIHLYTIISSVTMDFEDRTVSPGQIVKINAFNDVTKLVGLTGKFVNFSKLNHKIGFEFEQGGEYVEIFGSSLVISADAPDGAQIIFRACANKNSYSTEKIYSSNYGTLTVDRDYVNVTVRTDFDDPANIYGEGAYVPDKKITLDLEEKQGFKFLGWYIDGQYMGKDPLITRATFGQDIYAKFVKDITVDSISIASRVYDGTTDIENDLVVVNLAGVERDHDVYAAGLEYQYSSPDAGYDKFANLVSNNFQLLGDDKDLYNVTTRTMPSASGVVTKRPVTVLPEKASKQYGDPDPDIQYSVANLVRGETLFGKLSRLEGEKIGLYPITLGDMPLDPRNKNYDISLAEDSYFEITPRSLTLKDVTVSEKEYDRTTSAQISAGLKNIYKDEEVYVAVQGEFVSPNAGANVQVELTDAQLLGKDCENYVLEEYDEPIFGKINPKTITVAAIQCTRIYGDQTPLEYIAEGLLGDDRLSGDLALSSRNVGEREIELGSLANPNYVIDFVGATCTVTPRDLTVVADKQTKTFGDDDPELTYKPEGIVYDDVLDGKLDREQGEDVGEYAILIGSLSNENYNITFVGSALQITEREIEVEITFKDKEYDKTNTVEWTTEYKNNVTNAAFKLNLNAKLNSVDCGIATLNIEQHSVECDKPENFKFVFNFINSSVQILKRTANIFVTNDSKLYGEDDPTEFDYTIKNLIDGDDLQIKITRQDGRDAGQYDFYAQEVSNSNYKVVFAKTYFEILPRPIRVNVDNVFKKFGDPDPQIDFEVVDEFCFGDTDVVDGLVYRLGDESVGVYDFDFSKVSSNKNYAFVNAGDTHFIIESRPVVVTIYDATKVYGEDDPKFICKVDGDIENAPLDVEISRVLGADVGEYELFCKSTDPRYSITEIKGSLHITPSQITVKADDKTKVYGDDDPTYTVSVIDGLLKNNDRIEVISQGLMIREPGDGVGTYKIDKGDFSFGDNYILTFESGNLTIIKRHITITAQETSKIYGEIDRDLPYGISGDGLAFNDKISGKLVRDEKEDVGSCLVHRGDLTLDENNYDVTFVESTFHILPRPIEIVPVNAFKQFGEEDGQIEYQVIGGLVDGDSLDGQLYYKESRGQTRNNVGKYRIYSSLKNDNYEIVFDEYYFTIVPREIVVEAQSYDIVYGDEEPELSYKVTDGTVLDGDVFQGGLFRVKGTSVGTYDILSTLTLGRNYDLQFKKGALSIHPLSLTIQSENYTKVYGQQDPAFDYKIVDGGLINGDVLYGAITRQQGEDVGTYDLVKGVYNANYDITLLPAQLKILKKDVYLNVSVADKIYDGTTSAFITNAYVSGISNDVYLSYDKKACAEFDSAEIGKGIEVHLKDISLVGESADNYNLVYPDHIAADIAIGYIESDQVMISTQDPILEQDYALKYQSRNVQESVKIGQYSLKFVVDIWLEKDGKQIQPDGMFTINLNVPQGIYVKNNLTVFKKTSGGYEQVSYTKGEGGQLEVVSDGLGEFYVVIEDESWLDYGAYISLFVIGFTILCVTIITIKRKKAHKIKK